MRKLIPNSRCKAKLTKLIPVHESGKKKSINRFVNCNSQSLDWKIVCLAFKRIQHSLNSFMTVVKFSGFQQVFLRKPKTLEPWLTNFNIQKILDKTENLRGPWKNLSIAEKKPLLYGIWNIEQFTQITYTHWYGEKYDLEILRKRTFWSMKTVLLFSLTESHDLLDVRNLLIHIYRNISLQRNVQSFISRFEMDRSMFSVLVQIFNATDRSSDSVLKQS